MSRELRILHLADTHIGAALPSRPRVKRARRGDDLIASYQSALDRATEHEVDLVVHAGDVFDRPNPTGPALAAATAPLLELASQGIPVVIIPGNHERSALPGSLLLQHPLIHVIDAPRTLALRIRGQRVSVTGLPCVRRGVAGRFAERLADSDWQRERSDCHLLVLHQTLDSATCGPVGFRFRSGADVLDRVQVPASFDYVALGHIHRHQTLENPQTCEAPLVYAGSTDRISFAERDEPKGCVLIREQGGRLVPTFLEHDVRAMCVVPIDVTDLTRDDIIAAVRAGVGELPQRATVAIRLSGSARRRELAQLRLAQRIAALRPDLLVRISMQHIEVHAAERPRSGRVITDPLATLPPVAGPPVEVQRDQLTALPDQCGTYLLRDARGTVIYVGKSKRVRTRIRGHLRPSASSNLYAGWTENVQAALVRPAAGELEALLAEAVLVAHLRPAFNRQMRLWSRYCYLTEDPQQHGQLGICRDRAPREHVCHGPFRSRWTAEAIARQLALTLQLAECPADERGLPLLTGAAGALCQRFYDQACSGPCAGRIAPAEYAARLATRRALLRGAPHAEEIVLACEALVPDEVTEDTDPILQRHARQAETLRLAFETGRLLRRAGELRGGLLLLPAPQSGQATTVILSSPHPTMQVTTLDHSGLARTLDALATPPDATLAKQELDLYATIIRTLDSDPRAGLALSTTDARRLGTAGLRRELESRLPDWFQVRPLGE